MSADDEGVVPHFEPISQTQALMRAKPIRPARRNWKPIVEQLVKGKSLFMPLDECSDQDVKYLQLVFARRGKGERLRTERVRFGTPKSGVQGRQLSLAK